MLEANAATETAQSGESSRHVSDRPYAMFEVPAGESSTVDGESSGQPPGADASLRVLCSCWVHALATAGAVADPVPAASSLVASGRMGRISKDERIRALQAARTPTCRAHVPPSGFALAFHSLTRAGATCL
jgi:hypothetical protein